MIRCGWILLLAGVALAQGEAPPAIDATQAINDARDKLGDWKAYSGTLPMTVEVSGQAAEKASFAVAYQAPNQLRVQSNQEDATGKESILLVFAPETIWAEGRTVPAGPGGAPAPDVRVRKVIVDRIDSFTLGVLKRLDLVEGIPHLLFARPGLLLEFTAQCFSLTATEVGGEIAIEATRLKEPEGLDEAADVLEGVRRVRIVVAREDKRLLETVLEGGTGGKLTVSYRELGWDKAPEAALFEYKAPEGVQVEEIDERFQKPGPMPEGDGPMMEPPK